MEIPLDLKYHMLDEALSFSTQDPLHCLKKLRNHLKYTDTRLLHLECNPERYELVNFC